MLLSYCLCLFMLAKLWNSIIELNEIAMDYVGELYNEYFDN
jgi:hypothetical protein